MMWTPWHDRRVHAAAAVALSALALAGYAAVMALAEPQVLPARPLTVAVHDVMRPTPSKSKRAELVALAPFGMAEAAPPTGTADAPLITLVGTLAGADAPTAMCRLGALPARILHVGDTLGGWRLQHVSAGRAVFIDGASVRHELRLSPVGK